jgi:hypothetical protein
MSWYGLNRSGSGLGPVEGSCQKQVTAVECSKILFIPVYWVFCVKN